eukprot:scaffold20629_cov67-Phaeocystis_antarctica.AAC.6
MVVGSEQLAAIFDDRETPGHGPDPRARRRAELSYVGGDFARALTARCQRPQSASRARRTSLTSSWRAARHRGRSAPPEAPKGLRGALAT